MTSPLEKDTPHVLDGDCYNTVNRIDMYCRLQWNLSIKDTLNRVNLSTEDTARSAGHIELCTNLPLK